MKKRAKKDEASQEILAAKSHAIEGAGELSAGGDDNAPAVNDEQACMRQILSALTAYSSGDFSQRLPVGWTGIHGKIAAVINEILELSRRRGDETARVCRMVGKESKLQQRMALPDASGGWADEIQALNTLIADLADQIRNITDVAIAVTCGDLSRKITADAQGDILELKDAINMLVDQLNALSSEVDRTVRDVPLPETPIAPAAAVVFSHEDALSHCFQSREMVREMIQCFFDDADKLFPQMRAALAKGDLVAVGRLGHRMKGTAAYLGAQPAKEAALCVERFCKTSGGTPAEAEEAINVLEQECLALKAALGEHPLADQPAQGD